MLRILSTFNVEEHQRLAYWCDMCCNTFVQVDVKSILKTSSFFGSMDTRHLSDLQFTNVKSGKQNIVRSASQIAKAKQDYFLINIQLLGGESAVSQDGRTAVLRQDQFCLYDTTRIYELSFTESYEQMVLRIPKDRLKPLLILPEKTIGRTVDGSHGLGKITLDFILSTYQEIASLSAHELGRASNIILELLAICFNESVCGPRPSSRTRMSRLLEIKHFIDSRLRDPLLNVDMVANALQLSPRYVRMVFEGENITVAGYIRERRLQKCKEDLEDINQLGRSITDIAYCWGFNSSSHFSHLFSERFGLTPRDFRAGGSNPA